MMEVFYILIVVMAWVCTFVKTLQTIHLKCAFYCLEILPWLSWFKHVSILLHPISCNLPALYTVSLLSIIDPGGHCCNLHTYSIDILRARGLHSLWSPITFRCELCLVIADLSFSQGNSSERRWLFCYLLSHPFPSTKTLCAFLAWFLRIA